VQVEAPPGGFDALGIRCCSAVRVGCQRRREGGFRVVLWRGEVARRRKSHGGGGSTSGGFVGWKNELGFDVCGSVGRFRLTR